MVLTRSFKTLKRWPIIFGAQPFGDLLMDAILEGGIVVKGYTKVKISTKKSLKIEISTISIKECFTIKRFTVSFWDFLLNFM